MEGRRNGWIESKKGGGRKERLNENDKRAEGETDVRGERCRGGREGGREG